MNATDLQRFCADANDARYFIRKPWSRGEFTYATNGHIILCVQRLPDVAEEPKAPDAAGLFAKVVPASDWTQVPEATMPPDVECDECKGSGVYTETYGYETYSEDCEWCGHTGKVKASIGVPVGNAFFDQGYLSMIQGWEISPNGLKPAWIRNGDTVGLLMPRTRL